MRRVVIDIETRNAADLRKVGAFVYAEHPTVAITHVGWCEVGGKARMWRPLADPIPADLYLLLVDPGTTLVAHNAEFERTLLTSAHAEDLGIPVAALHPFERWDCTAARAARIGLPRSLDGACAALGMPLQKDKEGHALMLRVCKPRKPRKDEDPSVLHWWEDETRMARMDAYCLRDVEAEVGLDAILPPLSPFEREVWQITCEMNDRGVTVDADLIEAVPRMIEQAEARLNEEISVRTLGAVPAITDTGALARWLTTLGIEDHIDPTTRDASVAKAVVAGMIENTEIDPFVRQVLCLRRDGGGSGAKKWKAIEARLSRDGRLRGALVYCGAASTGRWSSRGAQLQNMVRGGTIKDLI